MQIQALQIVTKLLGLSCGAVFCNIPNAEKILLLILTYFEKVYTLT